MGLILAIFLIFLLGYLVVFSKEKEFLLVFAESFLVGISFLLIFGYLFSLLKIFNYFPIFLIILSLGLLIIKRKNFNFKEAIFEKNDFYFLIFCFLLSLIGGFFNLLPHYEYKWPIHNDEWWIFGIAKNIKDGMSINSHPYHFDYFFNFKPGSSIFIAYFDSFYNIENWSFFPFFNVFLISFLGSIYLYYFLERNFIALLWPVFFTFLRSNAYFLGFWFFVPFTFSFLFILPLLFYSLYEKKDKKIIFTSLISLALTYLPYLTFLTPLIFAIDFQKILRAFKIFLIFIFLLFLFFLKFSPYKFYWEDKIPLLSSFFVPITATIHPLHYKDIFIVLPLPLALLALIYFLRYRNIFILTLFLILTMNYLLILLFNVSFATFHQRSIYLLSFLCAFLSVPGFYVITQTLSSKISLWIILVFVLIFNFLTYFKTPYAANIYYLLTPYDEFALQWLKNQNLKDKKVFSDFYTGTFIGPITRLYTYFSLINFQERGIKDYNLFFTLPCDKKLEILKELNPDIIYSKLKQDCEFLEEIYSNEKVFLYLPKKEF